MDVLSAKLQCMKVGCYVNNMILNHLLYADDIVVFAPSVNGLQQLVNVCYHFISEGHLSLNVNKTKCMIFSKNKINTDRISSIVVNGSNKDYVSKIKYLGFNFTSHNSDDDHVEYLYRGLCARGNMILRNFSKCNADVMKMLFQSFCVNFYCMSQIFNVKQHTMNKLKVCYNDSFRRLMGVPRYASASALFVTFGLPSFQEVRRKNITSYLQRMKNSENKIIVKISDHVCLHNSIFFKQWRRLAYA